jgi:hypothetical protein
VALLLPGNTWEQLNPAGSLGFPANYEVLLQDDNYRYLTE